MTTATVRKPRWNISLVAPIAVGILFLATGALLSALALARPANAWSLFILFPGLILLGTAALLAYTNGWRFAVAIWTAGVGLVLSTVAALFLAEADWGFWWPLMLIVPGAALALMGAADVPLPVFLPFVRMHIWLGADILILGIVFLVNNFTANAVLAAWQPFHWWGIFILIPGAGAFYNAANAVRSGFAGRHMVVRYLTAFGLAACAVALATFLNAGWELQTAVGLASAGLFFLL